jgi:hypothetical protein
MLLVDEVVRKALRGLFSWLSMSFHSQAIDIARFFSWAYTVALAASRHRSSSI